MAGVAEDRELAVQIDRWTADAASALERHDEAKAAAQRGLDGARTAFGPEHWTVCALLATQVSVLHRAGDLDAAEAAYPELLARTRAIYGDQHPNVLMTLNNQAHLLMSRGKRDAAIEALRGIVAVYDARDGAWTVEHLTAVHNLGMALNMTGRQLDAEPLLARAATASRSLLDAANPEGAMMRFNHGACLAWLKHWSEAEPVLLAEFDALAGLLPANHPVLGKCKRTLVDAFRVDGKSEQLPKRLR